VNPRTRRLTFGSAGVVVLIGVIVAVVVNGYVGMVAGVTLITLGLGAVVLLVFLEIGLSEEHALEREAQSRRASTRQDPKKRRLWSSERPPRRPS
jgi:hypothetical protein